MARAPDLESWHLDKRVPVGIILAIVLQTAGLVWWASKMDSRIASLEDADRRADQIHAMTEAKLEGLRTDRERLVKIETQIEQMARSIGRIEAKLDSGTGNGGR